MADHAEESLLATGSLAGSEEVLVIPEVPARSSNKRALKVAGLTTLACLLLASQVFTAYMVFDQKQQIHSLTKSSERLDKQLSRPVKAPIKMHMPMRSFPLLTAFTSEVEAKTPLTKLQDTVSSMETQLKDLMQNPQLPQFNETFLANLQSMKQHVNESEWTSFESWMRYWLIFQMAQKEPAPPAAKPVTVIKTNCQIKADLGEAKVGFYKPQCDERGNYLSMQCWHGIGYCWCVDSEGTAVEGTRMRGHPECQTGIPRRMEFAPMLMQKTLIPDD
ncbi:CD74 molecule, major histocompatibility complex, class II invariant chain a [Pseudochaenichthys georgianus]|uniref:CD74 molecule, major histocompatibility complex, class II invariant chain a n=1 Tax=Pseudochaenichthys georgianus TaxID=52239 RepID=UPI00146BA91C|nr:CD74 molecule, major histocompatibility complex, class II invariant chain a [Pseudochaenichthys georgianus]